MKVQPGWVLIQPETDEFYGLVQYRDENGNMNSETHCVEMNHKRNGYVFCNAGLGKLKLLK